MNPIASVWTLYGLSGDPYFQDPLSAKASPGSPRSTDRFVGREREIALVGGNIVGADAEGNSRTIVEGAPGVGKTSFVNRVKDLLATGKRPPVLTHAQPIRVVSGMSPRAFTTDILRTLLLIHAEEQRREASPTSDAFWRRIRRIVHGEDTTAVGISVAGMGGSVEMGRIGAEVTDGSFYEEVAQAIRLLAGRQHRRILLHINNLENLTDSASVQVGQLIQNVRDYFLIPHSHWIFVGAIGVDNKVFRFAPQVSGIMPPPVILEPLDEDAVLHALHLRYDALRQGRKLVEPVASDAIRGLYRRYSGDLRNFLRVLSNGVKAAAVSARPLTESEIVRSISYEYRRWLIGRIGEESVLRLQQLFEENNDVVRATEVATRLGLTVGTAARFLAQLESQDVIRRSRVEGRSVYYAVTGDTGIALGKG